MNIDTKILLDEIEKRLEPKFDHLYHSLKSEIVENRKQIEENRKGIEENSSSISEIKLSLENEIRPAISEIKLSLDNEIRPEIKDLRLSLENEIRPKINLLAEGHSILNRKLDQIISREDENDLAKLHISVLETRVDRLEEAVFTN